jgi:hypothetical protein
MLDWVCFRVVQRVKKHFAKDPSVPVTEDHAMRMFRALNLLEQARLFEGR